MKRLFKRFGPFMVSMILTFGMIVIVLGGFFQRLEDVTADFKMRLRGGIPHGEQVVVVSVDEKSIHELGRWPWPRSVIGDIIDKLTEYGAKTIVFDVVFDTPDTNLNVQFVNKISNRINQTGLNSAPVRVANAADQLAMFSDSLKAENARLKTLEKSLERSSATRGRAASIRQVRERISLIESSLGNLSKETSDEVVATLTEDLEALRDAVDKAGIEANTDAYLAEVLTRVDTVVLGYFAYMTEGEVADIDPSMFDADLENIAHAEIATIRMEISNDPDFRRPEKRNPLEALGIETNLPLFSKHSYHHGYFNVKQDIDGTIRHSFLTLKFRDRWFPSMDLAAASHYLGKPIELTLGYNNFDQQWVESLSLGDQPIPVGENGFMLVNYHDTPKSRAYKEYSAADVISGFDGTDINPYKVFKDKLVVFGATAIGIYDLRVTPIEENYPGVFIHANILDSIINNDFMTKPGWMGVATIGLIFIFGLVLGIVLPKMRAISGFAFTMVIGVGYASWDFYSLFLDDNYRTDVVAPIAHLLLVYLAITLYRYATEEREKKFVRETFGRYLDPAVVDQLMNSPDLIQLGGEELELTAFFSDIEKFSTISEQLGSSQRLVALLNDYLSEMAHIIESHQGTIDKYEGDAIIAFFGAPLHYEDHAARACLATIDQQAKMVELREKWAQDGDWPEIVSRSRVRMGINTGQMTVGNMGSRGRMNYTIMGDAVNLAARLEGANKPYGTYMMISEYTYEAAKNVIECRELDSIRVVGKSEPVKVYELLARKGELDAAMREKVGIFQAGLVEYKKQNWDAAIEFFQMAIKVNSGDSPSETYISRCEDFKINPPGSEWDGVFELSSK